MKKLYSFGITTALLVTSFAFLPPQQIVNAQACIPGESPGNLFGYAWSDEIGPIYMSSETWNADPLSEGHAQTSVGFYVTFDRQISLWGGRGWNPVVGWVDFGEVDSANIAQRRAEFESIKNNGDAWGDLESKIYLGNETVELYPGDFYEVPGITYETETGSFEGLAWNGTSTMAGSGPGDDDIVGAGSINFANVQLETELTNCDEAVNIVLNGVNVLYQETCSISKPTITWTSVDVSNCRTNVGLWSLPGERGTSGNELASGDITLANTPVIFRVRCTGDGSGASVYGTAYASCGPSTGCTNPDGCNPIDPTTGIVIPEFKEV